jgi:hypothetical protein
VAPQGEQGDALAVTAHAGIGARLRHVARLARLRRSSLGVGEERSCGGGGLPVGLGLGSGDGLAGGLDLDRIGRSSRRTGIVNSSSLSKYVPWSSRRLRRFQTRLDRMASGRAGRRSGSSIVFRIPAGAGSCDAQKSRQRRFFWILVMSLRRRSAIPAPSGVRIKPRFQPSPNVMSLSTWADLARAGSVRVR